MIRSDCTITPKAWGGFNTTRTKNNKQTNKNWLVMEGFVVQWGKKWRCYSNKTVWIPGTFQNRWPLCCWGLVDSQSPVLTVETSALLLQFLTRLPQQQLLNYLTLNCFSLCFQIFQNASFMYPHCEGRSIIFILQMRKLKHAWDLCMSQGQVRQWASTQSHVCLM